MTGRSAVFDQRGQRVDTQYNIAGDMNVGAANAIELTQLLVRLRAATQKATEENLLSEDQALDVDYNLGKAHAEIRKPSPDRNSLTSYLTAAKQVVSNVGALASLVDVIGKCIARVSELF
jgi:hypothetical protein